MLFGSQVFEAQALFYIIGTCALSNPPNSIEYVYRIGDSPITLDLSKYYVKKHPLCKVTYQKVNLEPSQMMNSDYGFVREDLENPGRYLIHTTSSLYRGSASMTIRQYIKGDMKAETRVKIKLKLGKLARNPVTIHSGIECQTQSYRIETGKLTDIILPLCIIKISEINEGILDVDLGTIKKFSKIDFIRITSFP
jgi:hypothetical protein